MNPPLYPRSQRTGSRPAHPVSAPGRPWKKALRLGAVAALVAWGLGASPAWAQYKVVNPDGSVTYTDRLPAQSEPGRVTPLGRRGASAPAEGAASGVDAGATLDPSSLPADLRRAVQRYPATLYSMADCPSCTTARQYLMQRGVPFVERRVSTEADAQQLERLAGSRVVPTLTLGSQPVRGYSETEWQAYFDAAGYPRQSRLPRQWQPAPPQPMSGAPTNAPARSNAPALVPTEAASAPQGPRTVPPPPAASSPIRF